LALSSTWIVRQAAGAVVMNPRAVA
jgi:hypothetical protein